MFRKIVALWVSLAMLVGFVVLVVEITPNVEAASTIYVGGTGPGNYTSIQWAIDNATNGDTVFVYSGTYYENVVVNKSINLTGKNNFNTIINGGDVGDVIWITADRVNTSGFTFTNSGSVWDDAAIKVDSNNNTISDNIISDNYLGIFLENSEGNNIYYNTISWSESYGVYLKDSNGNCITDNIFSYNDIGIRLKYSNLNKISRNTFSYHVGTAVVCRDTENNDIIDNIISDNGWGIGIDYTNKSNIIGNTLSNNARHGINIHYSNENNIMNNTVSGSNIFGMIVQDSRYNFIINNTLRSNEEGLRLSLTWNNTIYHNCFLGNKEQALDNTHKNIWDNGYPSGGNYWGNGGSDIYYGPNQNLTGSDGIVDSRYKTHQLIDHYPLTEPYNPDNIVPDIRLISPMNSTGIKAGTGIEFLIDEENLMFVNYSTNGGGKSPFHGPFILSTENWMNGSYYIQIDAMDREGNKNSVWFFLLIDSIPPTITDLIGVTFPRSLYSYHNISANISDSSLIESVFLSVNGPNGDTIGNSSLVYDSNTGRYYDNRTYHIIGHYEFIIWTKDICGNWNSTTGEFTIATIPDSVQDLLAITSDSHVKLTWNDTFFDGYTTIIGYRIYRGEAPGNEKLIDEIGNLSYYIDTNVTNGKTYYYKISAVNLNGEGAQSSAISATPIGSIDAKEKPLPWLWIIIVTILSIVLIACFQFYSRSRKKPARQQNRPLDDKPKPLD